jgi:putative endonuclease
MSNAHALGKSGEEAAVAYLKKKRFQVLERGFRFRRGEIDIIARENDTLVFIEVKTRQSLEFGLPEESVTPLKQQQIRRLAEAYLATTHLCDIPCRFDIISLFYSPKDGYRIHHLRDAF